jgi:uncharacterized protein
VIEHPPIPGIACRKPLEMTMPEAAQEKLATTGRTKLRRFPVRGSFDTTTVYAILDKAPIAHIGFTKDGTPAMLPMVFWRRDDHIYFHGAAKNRMFGAVTEDPDVCVTATLIDGFVAARAALHHSMNYRSVIIYGRAEEVADPVEKLAALRGLIERFYPERWDKIRQPSPREFQSVSVYRLPIHEASAKIRSGFPAPYPEDFGREVWAGFIPVQMTLGAPQMDPNSDPATTPPQDMSRLEAVMASTIPAATAVKPKPKPTAAAPTATEPTTATITFELADGNSRTVIAKTGTSVMEAATGAGVSGIVAECGGSMACGTCHIYVATEWAGRLPRPTPGETAMLEFVEGGPRPESRLSCQIKITEGMDGLRVKVPDAQR